jgi:hypothetical protein
MSKYCAPLAACLVMLVLVTGCGSSLNESTTLLSPPATASAAPSATSPILAPTRASATPTERFTSALPAATVALGAEPAQAVVLVTNDNWGETEPCG